MSWLWIIPIIMALSFLMALYDTWRDKRDLREYDHKALDIERFKKENSK